VKVIVIGATGPSVAPSSTRSAKLLGQAGLAFKPLAG
jgi:hypothetical protein